MDSYSSLPLDSLPIAFFAEKLPETEEYSLKTVSQALLTLCSLTIDCTLRIDTQSPIYEPYMLTKVQLSYSRNLYPEEIDASSTLFSALKQHHSFDSKYSSSTDLVSVASLALKYTQDIVSTAKRAKTALSILTDNIANFSQGFDLL